ncbi:MAG: hypothetical protein KJ620_01355 [Candidatus Edwardsbacteria bacterium]|nr:hypothetical protein [Candidatus Edwardsbacteria bacterium]MBU1577034.1 hypothetical protein [Candidatus Edwardsbacteria bacterium]MBU2464548.1 hypothetical protein [Candidatus Edwardsbacteria bacterium]MBU2593411.1 hypothetical protein [Candidatus Edwardsbacteria bacterium]
MRFWHIILSFILLSVFSRAYSQELPDPGDIDEFRPFTILAPLPDSVIPSGEALEISLLLEETSGMDIHLLLDGEDITTQTQITKDYLFYLSPEPPTPGPHRITVLFTSLADTVFKNSWDFKAAALDTVPIGPIKIPLDISLTAGMFYSQCNKDTAGLSLSYPIGWHPSGDVNLSGQLDGGFFNSYLSYDPAYDKYLHGLLQFENSSFGLSAGEFYPELSTLVFSGTSPLGLLATWQNKKTSILGTACRTQPADTLFQTYAQYLYGGRIKRSLADSLWLSGGYLYGYDQPGSLPDSVRFRSSTYIYNDTLTGFSDTLITVDTLLSGKNRLSWFSLEWTISGARFRSEYAGSGFLPDSSAGYINDHSYLLGVKKGMGRHWLNLEYISWGQNFKSFGNPYLETAKNELLGTADLRFPGSLSARLDGSVYKIFTDSASGSSFKLGGGMNYAWGRLTSASLRLDYNYRPYITYLYQNRSLSLSTVTKLMSLSVISSYSYSSSSGISLTQSHNGMLGISRYLMADRLYIQASGQHYQVFDSYGLTDQARTTAQLRASWQASIHTGIIFDCRNILHRDRVTPDKNYRQQLASLSVSYRF